MTDFNEKLYEVLLRIADALEEIAENTGSEEEDTQGSPIKGFGVGDGR